jgi:hypothetical protein
MMARVRFVMAFVLFLPAACRTLPRLPAVPQADEQTATVLGLKDMRFWGDAASPTLIQDGVIAYRRELAAYRASGNSGPLPPANYLAISGGGENGAFGAGLLVGWSDLGSRYDSQLRHVFTQISSSDIYESRDYLTAFFQDALTSTERLRNTIARYVTPEMLSDIAVAYHRGRLLLIGTTNLDAGRPVIWDVGNIAASGQAGALRLIQTILIASAAVPGAFPPAMIDVEASGHHYQEMHVDGGASAQVFVYPPSIELDSLARRAGIIRERRLYLIRNARLDPKWAEVTRRTISIAERAVTSLIQTQGVGDLYRMFVAAQRDSIEFNLTSIPSSFQVDLKEPFDREYMNALFGQGYRLGLQGYPWTKVPPGYTVLGVGPTLTPTEPIGE